MFFISCDEGWNENKRKRESEKKWGLIATNKPYLDLNIINQNLVAMTSNNEKWVAILYTVDIQNDSRYAWIEIFFHSFVFFFFNARK